jgi:uncharacterized protein with HEPN domain
MIKRTYRDFVQDILDSIDHIENFTQGFNFKQFVNDQKTFYAVTRAVEIIGESKKSIPRSHRKRWLACVTV